MDKENLSIHEIEGKTTVGIVIPTPGILISSGMKKEKYFWLEIKVGQSDDTLTFFGSQDTLDYKVACLAKHHDELENLKRADQISEKMKQLYTQDKKTLFIDLEELMSGTCTDHLLEQLTPAKVVPAITTRGLSNTTIIEICQGDRFLSPPVESLPEYIVAMKQIVADESSVITEHRNTSAFRLLPTDFDSKDRGSSYHWQTKQITQRLNGDFYHIAAYSMASPVQNND